MSRNSDSPAVGILRSIRGLQTAIATIVQPFALLVTRVIFGYALFLTGKGKLGNLDAVAGYFAKLGIPAAKLNAIMAASVETFCGLLLVFGLATRFSAAAIMVVMTVAMLTAHTGDLDKVFGTPDVLFNPAALIDSAPFPFFIVALLIGVFGAGKLSLDHVLGKKLFGDQ